MKVTIVFILPLFVWNRVAFNFGKQLCDYNAIVTTKPLNNKNNVQIIIQFKLTINNNANDICEKLKKSILAEYEDDYDNKDVFQYVADNCCNPVKQSFEGVF